MIRAASHVLMIEPRQFRFNPETAASNSFQAQQPPTPAEAASLASLALDQHRVFRDRLVTAGVAVTVCRSLASTPDAPFCNNWFSTHPTRHDHPATLVVYPLLSELRRAERRADLLDWLGARYRRVMDLSAQEQHGRFLESTGSLCLDHEQGVAYAALSPRTDRGLAEQWARDCGYELVAFTATDGRGLPYYHTNVMMFVAGSIAGVVLESIADPEERARVERSLTRGGRQVLSLTRAQAAAYCGNCLALSNEAGSPLLAMSTSALTAFEPEQRAALEATAQIVHADLSAFERLAGGSARCLLAELY